MFKKSNCHARKGLLVLDVSAAKVPGVACVNLNELPLAHFHVRSSDQGSALGYADDEGRFTAIATFADRAQADKALEDIRAALRGGGFPLRLALKILAALLVGFGVLMLISALGSMQGASSPAAQPRGGMPVDADSKLRSGE
ncbi:MAG TPA: hypothetical protein VHB73_05900 [Alphaproteobacteria bacterium]|nr:hypothetical protein [Alphaproteobacteria bacterium]